MVDEQKVNKKALTDYFKNINPDFVEERGKLMPEAIRTYIEEHQSELLVIMSRKHSLLERLIVKSNVDFIGYHTKIPFLVIPEASE